QARYGQRRPGDRFDQEASRAPEHRADHQENDRAAACCHSVCTPLMLSPSVSMCDTCRWRDLETPATTFLGITQRRKLSARVLYDQQRNERSKQRVASLANVVHKLEETQGEGELLL